MRYPSKKTKIGRLRVALNKFEKVDQTQFAELIGCSVHTVVSLEVGRLQPSREIAWRIAKATGVALHWLISDNLRAPIVNYAGRRYTQKDFEQATKRSSQKEFTRTVTEDYANKFDKEIRLILLSAVKKDLAPIATRKIEKFLYQCRCEFEPDFELRETRWLEQAAMTPAQRAARIRKRDAAARAYEKRLDERKKKRR